MNFSPFIIVLFDLNFYWQYFYVCQGDFVFIDVRSLAGLLKKMLK